MKKITLMTLLIFGISMAISCQSKSNEKDKKTDIRFTYEIELAGYEFGLSDKKGEIDFKKFVEDFDKFSWGKQVEKANQTQKASPTLSVNDNKKDEVFWVSAAGSRGNFDYLIGHVFLKEIKKENIVEKKKWVVMYWTGDSKIVKKCFKLFFEGKTKELMSQYSVLEKYDEMEAFQK